MTDKLPKVVEDWITAHEIEAEVDDAHGDTGVVAVVCSAHLREFLLKAALPPGAWHRVVGNE
jgi:hypothetical protein